MRALRSGRLNIPVIANKRPSSGLFSLTGAEVDLWDVGALAAAGTREAEADEIEADCNCCATAAGVAVTKGGATKSAAAALRRHGQRPTDAISQLVEATRQSVCPLRLHALVPARGAPCGAVRGHGYARHGRLMITISMKDSWFFVYM